jgi:hypothetical protein
LSKKSEGFIDSYKKALCYDVHVIAKGFFSAVFTTPSGLAWRDTGCYTGRVKLRFPKKQTVQPEVGGKTRPVACIIEK